MTGANILLAATNNMLGQGANASSPLSPISLYLQGFLHAMRQTVVPPFRSCRVTFRSLQLTLYDSFKC